MNLCSLLCLPHTHTSGQGFLPRNFFLSLHNYFRSEQIKNKGKYVIGKVKIIWKKTASSLNCWMQKSPSLWIHRSDPVEFFKSNSIRIRFGIAKSVWITIRRPVHVQHWYLPEMSGLWYFTIKIQVRIFKIQSKSNHTVVPNFKNWKVQLQTKSKRLTKYSFSSFNKTLPKLFHINLDHIWSWS